PNVAATPKPTTAPISIWPSTPRLMMPARWVSVSPSSASSSGVALRSIAAAQARTAASPTTRGPAARDPAHGQRGGEQQSLQDRRAGSRHARIELQGITGGDESTDEH